MKIDWKSLHMLKGHLHSFFCELSVPFPLDYFSKGLFVFSSIFGFPFCIINIFSFLHLPVYFSKTRHANQNFYVINLNTIFAYCFSSLSHSQKLILTPVLWNLYPCTQLFYFLHLNLWSIWNLSWCIIWRIGPISSVFPYGYEIIPSTIH